MELFWYKYKYYGLKHAPIVNKILLWSVLPLAVVTYFLMYIWLPSDDIANQWYVYFVGQSSQHLILSCIIYKVFKNTRHAGMSTSVLIYSIFKFIEALFNLQAKTPYIDLIFKLLILGLAFCIIHDYLNRKKHDCGTTKQDF